MNCFRSSHTGKTDRIEGFGFDSKHLLKNSFRNFESQKPIKIIAEQRKVTIHWEDEILEKKQFTNTRGHRIMWYSIRPKDETAKPRALIMIQHGYAEHFLWHNKLARRFINERCLVFGYDSEGHGRSEGPRGVLTGHRNQVSDIHQSVQIIRREYPTLPLYVVSFSAGSAFTLCALLKYPKLFSGAVILAPPVQISRKFAAPTKKIMAYVLYAFDPYHKFKTNFDVSVMTKDGAFQEKLLKDPLFWKGDYSVCNIVTSLKCVRVFSKHMHELNVPFLILHGEEDRLCMVKGAKRLVTEAASKDKHIIIHPGAHHQLLMETDEIHQNVVNNTVNWICERIKEPIVTDILKEDEDC